MEVTIQIETLIRELSARGIIVPDPAEVGEYLLQHPDMLEIVDLASAAAAKRFNADSQLSLEVYHDPEIEDVHLVLNVRRDKYDEHFLDLLEEVSGDFERELAGRSGWFLLTTDFHPPKGDRNAF